MTLDMHPVLMAWDATSDATKDFHKQDIREFYGSADRSCSGIGPVVGTSPPESFLALLIVNKLKFFIT